MDYERDAGGDTGQQPDSSETPMTDAETPATDAAMAAPDAAMAAPDAPATDSFNTDADAGAGAQPGIAANDRSDDFGTDADVMNDAFENHEAAPPEWPAADFAVAADSAAAGTDATGATEMNSAVDDSTAATEIAATYAAATEEPGDVGDDSDAPILEDASAASTPVATSADAAASQSYIQADNVTLRQAGAQTIQASTVTVSQGGAGQVHADTVSVEQGGLGLARTKTLTLGAGASAFAVVADEATVEQGSQTFLVVSRSFNGDVQPTIDWRVAAAFGAGLGLALSILRRLR